MIDVQNDICQNFLVHMPFGSLQTMLFPFHIQKNFCRKRINNGSLIVVSIFIYFLWSFGLDCAPTLEHAMLQCNIEQYMYFLLHYVWACYLECFVPCARPKFLNHANICNSKEGCIYERVWTIACAIFDWLYRFLQYIHKCHKSYHYNQHTSKILAWLAMNTL